MENKTNTKTDSTFISCYQYLSLMLLLAWTPSLLFAQAQIQWTQNYGGLLNDIAFSATLADNGQTVLAGISYSNNADLNQNQGKSDAWLIKIDTDGTLLWSQTFGGSQQDELRSIQTTSDGGFVMAGHSFSNDGDLSDNNGEADFWIVKVDANGQLEWSKTYGGSGHDQAVSIQLALDGTYFVVGHSLSADLGTCGKQAHSDICLLKLDESGDLLWSKTYGAQGNDWASAVWVNADQSLVLAGYSDSKTALLSNNHGSTDAWVIKLNSDGALIWSKQYGGTKADYLSSIHRSNNNTYLLAGYSYSDDGALGQNQGLRDAWIMQIDENGNLIWSNNFGGSHHEEAKTIVPTNGGFLVGAYSWSDDGNWNNTFGHKDFYLIKVNPMGTVLWQQNFGGSESDEPYDLLRVNENSLLLLGASRSDDEQLAENKGAEDVWVVKLKENDNISLTINLGPDLEICPNESIELDATHPNCPNCIYQWNDGTNDSVRNLNPLVNTLYAVTITNETGSTASDEVWVVVKPMANILQINPTSPTCFGQDGGSIVLELASGVYDFEWSNGSSTQHLQNITAGTYTVTISGESICPTTENIVLSEPAELNAAIDIIPTGCGGPVGAFDVEPVGGTAPYTYLWNNGSTSQSLQNLAEGNYTLSISDQLNCQYIVSLNIPSTGDFNATVEVEPITCHDSADGAIDLEVATGINPIYVWNNGALTQDLSELSAGNYTVTIAMANGCLGVQSIDLIAPSPLTLHPTITAPSCVELTDGQIQLDVTGGTGSYQYLWSDGTTTASLTVGAGTYWVTIEDENACSMVEQLEVNEPNPIQIDGTSMSVSCNGATDGTIQTTASGGTGNLSYQWNTGQQVGELMGLSGGIYQLTVTDINGCTEFQIFSIFENSAIDLDITTTSPSSGNNNGSILIAPSGGQAPYQTLWSNGSTSLFNHNLSVGTYTVTIEDVAECTLIQSINLSELTSTTVEPELYDHFYCFPNPNDGRFTIDLEWKEHRAFLLQIFDVLGQKIQEKHYHAQRLNAEIDLEGLAAGIYFVRLETEGRGVSRKVVVNGER